ncbi:MAG: zinc ribbon domain-containing protein [Firmicutes bacterium]|nr:zinc ribbon domain-containing protein [Bacillota bacterium]
MSQFCRYCGVPLEQGVGFCPSCGTAAAGPPAAAAAAPSSVQPAPKDALAAGAVAVVKSIPALAGTPLAAPASAGEVAFASSFSSIAGEVLPELGPLQVLLSGGRSLLGSLGTLLNDKKKLIPVLLLALLWFLLLLLPTLGINFLPVRVLSWLTFAHGGTGGGILSVIGGITGKGVFAGLVVSLFSGSGAFQSLGRGLKTFFSSFASKGSGGYGALLLGAGLALIAYNFMAGSASLINVMAAVAPLLLSLKALGSRAGFLRRFFGSFARRPGKGLSGLAPEIPLAGLAAGFTLSIPLSALPFAFSGYILGVLLLAAGGILIAFLKDKGGAGV